MSHECRPLEANVKDMARFSVASPCWECVCELFLRCTLAALGPYLAVVEK